MASTPLAETSDLEDMWRPLDTSEVQRAENLLAKASALLRQVQPNVDARIAAFQEDPTDPIGVDPVLVATVVATIVKRFISNVEGATSQSIGPLSMSYALRGDKDVRGELQVTSGDLQKLQMYRPKSRIGSIRVRPSMAAPIGGSLAYYGSTAILATGWFDSAFEYETPLLIAEEMAFDGPDGLGEVLP